jgi:hypothetical protein
MYIAVPATDHEVDVVVVAVERGHEQVEFLLVQEVEVTTRLLAEVAGTDGHRHVGREGVDLVRHRAWLVVTPVVVERPSLWDSWNRRDLRWAVFPLLAIPVARRRSRS